MFLASIKRGFRASKYLRKWTEYEIRLLYTSSISFNKSDSKLKVELTEKLLKKYEDKVLFSSVVEAQYPKLGYHKMRAFEEKLRKKEKQRLQEEMKNPLPVSLKYVVDDLMVPDDTVDESAVKKETITHFPFKQTDTIVEDVVIEDEIEESVTPEREVQFRQNTYEDRVDPNWMSSYETYAENIEPDSWRTKYGTPDPSCPTSDVPCGGCGALLHCRDPSIPGYVPSEVYKRQGRSLVTSLKAIECQRCHFLKNYNLALQVRVDPEDYPKILEVIRSKRALVVLMVDLLDIPCSIWPGIIDIIGSRKPIVVVGNKVDLLPQDSGGYLDKIKKVLTDCIHNSGVAKGNILHVALISAKTGFGIEELVTRLHNLWKYKGDVFLVGCTNVGKSTLFNMLLQSDYCKVQAADLIQRATTSTWPGTTLNLLKFPILRPSGWRLYVRTKRLMSSRKLQHQLNKQRMTMLKETNNLQYATLMGLVERTFSVDAPEEEHEKDQSEMTISRNASGVTKIGINENEPKYTLSKWCYDTPGVVHPDQILTLLTTEELMLALPKELIRPRTFALHTGETIFIAGLGRLDYLDGPLTVKFTVFRSSELPITVCKTSDAEEMYNEFLGTELFEVPSGGVERLEQWPDLVASDEIKLKGVEWSYCCSDVVLSTAGWISVALGSGLECTVRAWTPQGRGIHVREPLLPSIVNLRGKRIRDSPAYRVSKYYVK